MEAALREAGFEPRDVRRRFLALLCFEEDAFMRSPEGRATVERMLPTLLLIARRNPRGFWQDMALVVELYGPARPMPDMPLTRNDPRQPLCAEEVALGECYVRAVHIGGFAHSRRLVYGALTFARCCDELDGYVTEWAASDLVHDLDRCASVVVRDLQSMVAWPMGATAERVRAIYGTVSPALVRALMERLRSIYVARCPPWRAAEALRLAAAASDLPARV